MSDSECWRCGDTGQIVKEVFGRTGMVPCPSCNQSPYDCDNCGRSVDRDEYEGFPRDAEEVEKLDVSPSAGDYVVLCEECQSRATSG